MSSPDRESVAGSRQRERRRNTVQGNRGREISWQRVREETDRTDRQRQGARG